LKTIAEKAKERHLVEALERVRQAVAEKRVSLMKRWPKQSEKLVSDEVITRPKLFVGMFSGNV
jgi:hypothetical protein